MYVNPQNLNTLLSVDCFLKISVTSTHDFTNDPFFTGDFGCQTKSSLKILPMYIPLMLPHW